ncbi:nitroreductase family protein [Desulforhopalus vacuolatus]|uniref:nitroreductase family protein n=1 Tax=Desulforhopalus vacuolatus TaxID=40414 RepID=UPI00196344E2|nr:nitroreductase family protein [Desulforhopalus vacuolatus]MBM9518497.1 nitroreductase family protein [Desulforhopalus vacuolatus]
MFIELMRKRRSIRKYEEKPLNREQIELLAEALLRAPSGKSKRSWQFILIQDREVLKQLAQAKPHGAAMLKGAALAVAVLGDAKQTDTWIEDCSAAAISAQYLATDLGLASCWVQIRGREHDEQMDAAEYVRHELGIPAELEVLCLLSFGWPAEEKVGQPREKLLWSAVHQEKF